MRTKLREIKEELHRRMHRPIPEMGKWLAQVVSGSQASHAVPTNSAAIGAFRYRIIGLWHRLLCRRSQKGRMVWQRMTKLADGFLPKPRVLHPWPSVRFAVRPPEVGAECPNWARSDLCGGRSAMSVPTADT